MPGKDIGYTRVSTHDQNTARQLDGVHLDKVFEEHASGKSVERPALQACLEYVRDGDVAILLMGFEPKVFFMIREVPPL